MPFLTLSSANIDFLRWELRCRTYTTKKVFPTTKRVKLIGKKEFAATALDPEYETFVIHVASISSIQLDVRPQIPGFIVEKASTKIFAKYLGFADVFSPVKR